MENMGTETTGFVNVKGLAKRVQEAEKTEADLIRDIKRLPREAQKYIHQLVKEQLPGYWKEEK